MNNYFSISKFKDQGLDEEISDEDDSLEENENKDINENKNGIIDDSRYNNDNKELIKKLKLNNEINSEKDNKDESYNSFSLDDQKEKNDFEEEFEKQKEYKEENFGKKNKKENEFKEEEEREEEEEEEEKEKEEKEKEKEEEKEKEKEEKEKEEKKEKNNINFIYAIEDNEDISKFDEIKNPAINYPFILDDFQKRSIIRLEQGQNVLVCAHTSSGKTVVAEYGIALGLKHSKRVIYTSPIKALSNQKYRDFKKRFDDVGILTGDVNINSDAQCLIMTTEILQSALYKNSEILSQLEWIIFDEIHYINDNERGHVWEEILILLPPGINLIMLSATIPNYMEFAKWVGSIKKTTVYVEMTFKRVIPLKHQIYIDSQNVFEVKGINGEVYDYRIRQALNLLKEINTNDGGIRKKFGNRKADEQQMINNIKYYTEQKEKYYKKKITYKFKNNEKDNNKIRITKMHHKLIEMVEYLQKNSLCPAVIFVFSIRRITEYTRMLTTKNLLNEQEKNKIIKFFNEVISSKLSKEDQEIPQIKEILEILKSGIGLHHAGLLPILKEIIEVLYSQGLIKVLFATTSFSIGLNMPTRTVVFTEIYKFNEDKKEILSSSEYLQMCGRAGRRGIDSIGNVYLIITDQNSKNEDEEIIHMLKGEGTDVKSKLRLSYKTFLSFSSRDKKNMQLFVQDSFLESRKALSIPEKIKELKDLKNKCEKLKFTCTYDKEMIIENRENISIYKTKNVLLEVNNKKNEKQKDKNDKKELDIEDLPCKDYYTLNEEYKNRNKIFFSSEKIYQTLTKFYSGKILKVKNKEKYFPDINKGNYVMIIHAYSPNSDSSYRGKLWCLGIKEYKKENNNDNEDYDDDFIGKGESDNISKIDENIYKEENEYKGYKYYYKFIEPEDIINIYDYPYIKGTRYMKENIIKKEGKYFYNYKQDFEKKILKELYEQIKDYFIEKNNKANKLDYDYSKIIDNDIYYKNILIQRKEFKNDAKNCLCYNCPLFNDHISKFYNYKSIQDNIEKINKEINPENMKYFEEFNKRKNILKEMNFINEDDMLTLKGKAAREINTTDCVIISEILISDILSKLNDDEIVAFLSGFATNKNQIEINYPKISDSLNEAYEKFLGIYEKIKNEEEKNNFEENKYNRRFLPDVSMAIKSWMNGAPFGEICKLTDLEEGKLYNLILRIFLFMEEIFNFYTVLGNVKETQRFNKIKNSLLRGIMGVQSLYLQDKIKIDLN